MVEAPSRLGRRDGPKRAGKAVAIPLAPAVAQPSSAPVSVAAIVARMLQTCA